MKYFGTSYIKLSILVRLWETGKLTVGAIGDFRQRLGCDRVKLVENQGDKGTLGEIGDTRGD